MLNLTRRYPSPPFPELGEGGGLGSANENIDSLKIPQKILILRKMSTYTDFK
jgi:hypothetical protein